MLDRSVVLDRAIPDASVLRISARRVSLRSKIGRCPAASASSKIAAYFMI